MAKAKDETPSNPMQTPEEYERSMARRPRALSLPESGPAPSRSPDRMFDQFWSAYPRKVDQQSAKRHWMAARRTGADLHLIVAAAQKFGRQCREQNTDPHYIPYPARWLNEERYSEEVAPPEQPVEPAAAALGVLETDERLLAAVVRLNDPEHPLSSAAAIVSLVRQSTRAADSFPVISDERAAELAEMPYPEYLQTPEWKERTRIMRKRAAHQCQVCCRVDGLQVHHRTYERRGNELPTDLTVLCDFCHDLFTKNGKLAKEDAA